MSYQNEIYRACAALAEVEAGLRLALESIPPGVLSASVRAALARAENARRILEPLVTP